MSLYIFSILYTLFTSISFILIAKSPLAPALTLLLSTLITTAFFHAVNVSRLKETYKISSQHFMLWASSSLFVALTWIASFYSANLIGAFPFIFIYFLVAATLGYIALGISSHGLSLPHVLTTLLMSITLLLFLFLNWENNPNYIWGIIFGIVGGVTAYLYRKVAFTYTHSTGFNASQVLALRSYLIIILASCLIKRTDFILLNLHTTMQVLGISAFGIILPVYCNQQGVMKAGPDMHSIIAGSCPLVTCLLEITFLRNLSLSALLFSFCGSFLLVTTPLIHLLKRKHKISLQ